MTSVTLDITAADLQTADARRRAVARLAGMLIWPDVPQRAAQWERAALAVARYRAGAAGEKIDIDFDTGSGLFAAGRMLDEARVRAGDVSQAGSIFGDCLVSNGEAGFGLQVNDSVLTPMDLTQSKLQHARWKTGRKGATRHETLAAIDKRCWARRGPVAHLCAAVVALAPTGAPFQPETFPCPEGDLCELLRTGEIVRRAAHRVIFVDGSQLRGRERLMTLSAQVLDAIRQWPGDEFAPRAAMKKRNPVSIETLQLAG